VTDVCPDCIRAEREDWPVYTAHRWCCDARAVSETVGRSGKGWTREDVQRELIRRVLWRANETEAAAFMARLEQLGVEVVNDSR
jgi:hypothetical protein